MKEQGYAITSFLARVFRQLLFLHQVYMCSLTVQNTTTGIAVGTSLKKIAKNIEFMIEPRAIRSRRLLRSAS
jgi:hypothetical protein